MLQGIEYSYSIVVFPAASLYFKYQRQNPGNVGVTVQRSFELQTTEILSSNILCIT